jgi:hypothetical protein
MPNSHSLRLALLGLLASGAIGCNLQIDQIFAMQEGSQLDSFLVSDDGLSEFPQGVIQFEGGAVMRIIVSSDLLDYLDGVVDGDVQLLDLLFAIPNLRFLISDVGLTCVNLDDPPGGGTFTYNALSQTAGFDVLVNSKAVPTDSTFQAAIQNGNFKFPFDLESEIPMTLVDALGLVTGTGSMVETQHIDQRFDVMLRDCRSCNTFFPFHLGVRGDVTLASTDTFPATPKVLACADFFAQGN